MNTRFVNFVNKERSWDENIGRLIVFAMTIIIAVWVLGVLAYFYAENREEAAAMSVLGSTAATSQDLVDIWVCADDNDDNQVEYNAVSWEYTVTCGDNLDNDVLNWFWQLSDLNIDGDSATYRIN